MHVQTMATALYLGFHRLLTTLYASVSFRISDEAEGPSLYFSKHILLSLVSLPLCSQVGASNKCAHSC